MDSRSSVFSVEAWVLCKLLEKLNPEEKVVILTDSKSVANVMSSVHRRSNSLIPKLLERIKAFHHLTIIWVPGHKGSKNICCLYCTPIEFLVEMYNPSRGGVRGGADQFTWESVKTDKHRENYLGHSLKAPVGRWQKGKDLSWYAKERKNESLVQAEKSELAAIKKAEEEAMLIALGHSIVKKESQNLTKEEMSEALRRNVGVRDELNIERVDGVGASSRRASLMTGIGKNASHKNEGVVFESPKPKTEVISTVSEKGEDYNSHKKKKSKRNSKKHKKEKKAKKRRKDSGDSEYSSDSEPRMKCKKSKRSFNTTEYESSKSRKSPPKGEKDHRKHHSQSSENSSYSHSKSRITDKSKHNYTKRQRHDSTDSDS